MKLTQLKNRHELAKFGQTYQGLSGIEVPIEFLESSDVLEFSVSGKPLAGFVLSHSKSKVRTLDYFVSDKYRPSLSKKLGLLENYSELCCFWISPEIRRNGLKIIEIWVRMAISVRQRCNKEVLFGTNSKKLAVIYGYPKTAVLIHKDSVNKRKCFVFIGQKKHFVPGLIRIALAKIGKSKPWHKTSFEFNYQPLIHPNGIQ